MNKQIYFCLAIIISLLFSLETYAQNIIKKKVTIINSSKQPINNAQLFTFLQKDSSLLNNFITNKKGEATIVFNNNVTVFITAQKENYKIKYVAITANLDTIMLFVDSTENIIITSKIPITIKEDTVQFNETLFKNDSLKTLEEVFKKLPGIQIQKDGTIEVNGIKISEILLDGKPIPINDMKMILQTLQGNLIDKIQFIDRKTDETRITGIDNGIREKVVNIKLKKKTKQIYNQDIIVGIGNNNRLEGRNNINIIKKETIFNININYNNTGRTNFSSINYYNPYGVSTGTTASLSYRFVHKKNTTVNNSVNFNGTNTILDEARNRIIFLKDSFNYYKQNLFQNTKTKSVGYNGNITSKFDTLSDFKMQYGISYNNNNGFRNELINTLNNSKFTTNEGTRNNFNNAKRINYSLNINTGRSSRNRKYSWFVNLQLNKGSVIDTAYQKNNLIFYGATSLRKDTLRQQILNKNININFRGSFNNTFKLITKLKLQIGVGLGNINNPNSRNALIYNYNTQQYNIANITLNNNVNNNVFTITQNIGLNYSSQKQSININVTNNILSNKNFDNIRDTNFNTKTSFITPSFNYNYFTKKQSLNFNTNIRQRNPTSRELIPVTDNTNPLFIRKGNPLLKNEITINNTLGYHLKPNKKQWSLNSNASATFTTNKIANNTFYDAIEAKQISIYTNLPQNYSVAINTTANKYITTKKINLSIGFALGLSNDNNYLNNILNKLRNFNFKPRLGFKIDKKLFYLEANIGYLYQTNTYSLRPTQNIKIGNITNDITLNIVALKNLNIAIDYDQIINNNQRSIQRVNNINGSIQYDYGKKKQLAVKLSAFDLLNNNSNNQQNINDYWEEFVTTNAIRRYFMCAIIYKFTKLKMK